MKKKKTQLKINLPEEKKKTNPLKIEHSFHSNTKKSCIIMSGRRHKAIRGYVEKIYRIMVWEHQLVLT